MKHQFVWIIVLSSFRNAQILPNHWATFWKKSGRIAIIGQTDKLVLGSAALVAASNIDDKKYYLSDVIFGAALGTAVSCWFSINYREANPSQ